MTHTDIDCSLLAKALAQLALLPKTPITEPNFFSLGGRAYLENPTSDLLAMFMGGHSAVEPWLAKALLCCLQEREQHRKFDATDLSWEGLAAQREVGHQAHGSSTWKRLDLVVSNEKFVIGIEHKITAGADANPFPVYDDLLVNQYRGRYIFRCVLHAIGEDKAVPEGWEIVSYEELVAKACALYALDDITATQSKWRVFYRELLDHLDALGKSFKRRSMDQQATDFAIANYAQLKLAADLLEQLPEKIGAEGVVRISEAFSKAGIENRELTTSVDLWRKSITHELPEDATVIRLRPTHWGGDSEVVLAYMTDNRGGSMRFFINAYVGQAFANKGLDALKASLQSATASSTLWKVGDDRKTIWKTGSYLAIRVWPVEEGKEGAMRAIAALAVWLEQNAFAPVNAAL